MNKTEIEWCDETWNPITGCDHGCEYCYARNIAHRFAGFEPRCGGEVIPDEKKKHGKNSIWNTTHGDPLHVFSKQPIRRTKAGIFKKANFPYDFDPTFHRYRLGEPARKTKPRNIFVCSMADLFGRWVPTSWILEVLDACLAAPQHRYLFLTKNSQRYTELDELALLPRENNFWYGTTIATGDVPLFLSDYHNTFISMEPILEPFPYPENPRTRKLKWIIMGAESGNRKDKVVPERSWVEPVAEFGMMTGIPVFMKDSMTPIWGEELLREFPWGGAQE